MAAALGDLLQLIDNQVYLGQQILNVYYYRVVSITGLADGYLSAINGYWEEQVLESILQIQASQLEHVSREWKNLSNGIDLFVDGTVIPGESVHSDSALLPSFISAGFILRRESLATRNGYKRFAGLSDTDVDGNEWTGTATQITDIEEALAADLTGGLVSIVEPVIVKRPIDPPVSSYVYSSVGSASFRGIGTQNTRKQGRGI